MKSSRFIVFLVPVFLVILFTFFSWIPAFASSPQITNGLTYLSSTQNPDGSWGGSPTSLNDFLPTTATALEALKAAQAPLSNSQTNAVAFLNNQVVDVNPYLAQRIRALTTVGGNVTNDLNNLLARQNPDGGWGTAAGYQSDPLDTAFILFALEAARVTESTVLNKAFGYLTRAQQADGGWALARDEDSRVFFSAVVLRSLNGMGRQFTLSSSQARALAFLRGRQHPDGGYGDSVSSTFETALAALAIFTSGQPLTPAETQTIDFLNGRQLANGSWEEDAYSTGLALQALAFPRDSDGDGITDDWELGYGLNPNDPSDADQDNDSDKLANLEEFHHGTHPKLADTDGDGVNDRDEILNGSDPLDPNSHNQPPLVNAPSVTSVGEGHAYQYQLQATDADGNPLVFSLLQGPDGMTVTPDGLIQWPGATVGTTTVIVQVDDGQGGKSYLQFQLKGLAQGTDLSVATVDIGGVTTDSQTLVALGTVRVEVKNQGGSTFDGSFQLLLFEDANGNDRFDPAVDKTLGAGQFNGSINSLASASIDVRVSGIVAFRDNRIHAWVDNAGQVPESDKNNNLGNSGLASRFKAPVGDFRPKVKWIAETPSFSAISGILNQPLVAPLIDTNHDGRVNERDIPAVIVAPQGSSPTALRGDTGETIFPSKSSPAIGTATVNRTAMAVGDIDGDGFPEIVAKGLDRKLYCFNNDGSLKWTGPVHTYESDIQLADLDGDGQSEILSGATVFNADGTIRWDDSQVPFGNLAASWMNHTRIADLDGDGHPEIVAGASAYDRNGKVLWYWDDTFNPTSGLFGHIGHLEGGETVTLPETRGIMNGTPTFTVANLDADPDPEIVQIGHLRNLANVTNEISLWIFAADGHVKDGPFRLADDVPPVNGQLMASSPPTIADFDGDGQPEIAVVVNIQPSTSGGATVENTGYDVLYLYRLRGHGVLDQVWKRPLTLATSVRYGPPVAFDLDGDGAAELIHQDGHKLYVLNGRDGSSLYEMAVSSHPLNSVQWKSPAVADVDNDGNAEIIVGAQTTFLLGAPRHNGVIVIGDTKDHWQHARRIWNQWAYHVTNINEDGSVPGTETPNWSQYNAQPAQAGIKGLPKDAAPDLTISRVTINKSGCPALAGITARIGNGGSLHVANGLLVNFYNGDPATRGSLLGTALTSKSLYPGEFEDVLLADVSVPSGPVFVTVNKVPVGTAITSANLAHLPNAWASGSGVSLASAIKANINAFQGIDGSAATSWLEFPTPSLSARTNPIFYRVNFPYPVNPSSVTITNSGTSTGFLGAGSLRFSNGFSVPINFDGNGRGAASFAAQQDVSWIEVTGESTKTGGASISEFIVGGTYLEPPFLLNEGVGRLANNKAVSGANVAPCDTSANHLPVVNSAPPINAIMGLAYGYSVQASDPDGDALSYALASAPPGMTIDTALGRIDWTPTEAQIGNSPVVIRVSDGRGGIAEQAFTVTVAAPANFNRPPQISSQPENAIPVSETFHYQITASDPDGDSLLFSLLQGPSGATVDLLNGALAWTPTAAQVGSKYFTVEAQDGRGGHTTQSFAVQVELATVTPPSQFQDGDGDDFDETLDCNDAEPTVNPGQVESPGNGKDDDCNAATPDSLPGNTLSCGIVTDKRSYPPHDLAQLGGAVHNLSSNLDIVGMRARVTVQDPVSGVGIFDTAVPLNVLSPNGLWRTSVLFGTGTTAPGNYPVNLGLEFGGALACEAQATLTIQSGVAPTGSLTGAVAITPTTLVQGQTASIDFQISNIGNANLTGLNTEVLILNLASQSVVQTLPDQMDLDMGNSATKTLPLPTSAINAGDYFVVLRGGQQPDLITLGSARFHVDAAAPKQADLGLAISASPQAMVGTHLTFTLTVANNGPDTASGVILNDSLPTSVSFVSATPSLGNCSGTSTVICQIGELTKGSNATVTIVLTSSSVGNLDNTATVAAIEGDPDPGNNSATATVTVRDRIPNCDVDLDRIVDRKDILLINAARGQKALPGDARDYNKDGWISITDSRACVLQCTYTNCASTAP